MRKNTLLQLKAQGRMALNGWVSVGHGYMAEVLGSAGFDAVTVDLQHSPYGFDTAVQLLQALSSTPALPLARCAGHTLAEINKLLDAGAYGIICPLVNTPEEAAAFARACRYPPRGDRSYGPARGITYGGPDYAACANDEILSLAMIETVPALEALDQILAVDELGGIFVGPSDLGLAMGVGSNAWPQPELVAAVRHIAERAHACGKYAGIFSYSPAMDSAVEQLGFDLVTTGTDVQLLHAGIGQRLGALRSGRSLTTARP